MVCTGKIIVAVYILKMLNKNRKYGIISIDYGQNSMNGGNYMTLAQGIVYYIVSFIITLAFIIGGCFLGVTLRKAKDAKLAAEGDNSVANDSEK